MLNFLLQASNEAAVEVVADALPAAGTPQWTTILAGIIGTLITIFLLPWLRQKANAARAEAAKNQSEAIDTQIDTKRVLTDQAKAFALDTAASIAEKRFPALQAKVAAGELKLDGATLKAELYSWGATLKAKIVEHFNDQGIDIVVALGDKYLDELIEWAANKVSPFPGRDTVVALLKDWDGKALEWLATKGVEWVRRKVETENVNSVN